MDNDLLGIGAWTYDHESKHKSLDKKDKRGTKTRSGGGREGKSPDEGKSAISR